MRCDSLFFQFGKSIQCKFVYGISLFRVPGRTQEFRALQSLFQLGNHFFYFERLSRTGPPQNFPQRAFKNFLISAIQLWGHWSICAHFSLATFFFINLIIYLIKIYKPANVNADINRIARRKKNGSSILKNL